MSVDHLVMYQKMTSNKRYGDPPPPDWVHRERFNYPHHHKHSELIKAYTEAKKQHDEWVEVLQSAYQRKWQDPENSRMVESVKHCQQQVEEAKKALDLAEKALQQFNDHTPEERVGFYEIEIREWETQLAEAQKAEQEYTKQLLDDPNAAARRLERMVHGYTGQKAEYSPEQLTKLRSLRNNVESIELKILNAQRDIERIHQLAAEQERKARIQAMMDVTVPKFNEACVKFSEAWGELQSLADEYGICVVSPHNLQIPTGAKFKQTNNPHEGSSSIYITVEK